MCRRVDAYYCLQLGSIGRDVAEKIKNNETLTEADYNVMADYVIDGYRRSAL